MRVIFRSNDMLTASGLNMYGLTHLQKVIADELDYNVGSYTHIALTPHIYHVRDSGDMLTMVEGVNRIKYPDTPDEHIKMQQWILNNIDNYAKEGRI